MNSITSYLGYLGICSPSHRTISDYLVEFLQCYQLKQFNVHITRCNPAKVQVEVAMSGTSILQFQCQQAIRSQRWSLMLAVVLDLNSNTFSRSRKMFYSICRSSYPRIVKEIISFPNGEKWNKTIILPRNLLSIIELFGGSRWQFIDYAIIEDVCSHRR